jgi:hypothetical protein
MSTLEERRNALFAQRKEPTDKLMAWVLKVEKGIAYRRKITGDPLAKARAERISLFLRRASEDLFSLHAGMDAEWLKKIKPFKEAVRISRNGGTERSWQILKPKVIKAWEEHVAMSQAEDNNASPEAIEISDQDSEDEDMDGMDTDDHHDQPSISITQNSTLRLSTARQAYEMHPSAAQAQAQAQIQAHIQAQAQAQARARAQADHHRVQGHSYLAHQGHGQPAMHFGQRQSFTAANSVGITYGYSSTSSMFTFGGNGSMSNSTQTSMTSAVPNNMYHGSGTLSFTSQQSRQWQAVAANSAMQPGRNTQSSVAAENSRMAISSLLSGPPSGQSAGSAFSSRAPSNSTF